MKNRKDSAGIWKGMLWVAGMLIILGFTVLWYWVVAFDTNEEVSSNTEINKNVFFIDYEANDNVDSWETQIQQAEDEEPVVYTGTTCACNIANRNSYNIKDWNLRLDIVQECFLYGFWCGSFEIHQFREGRELVNLLDSQKYDTTTLDIDRNLYSDASLIHLMPGDYLVYYPSIETRENIVEAHEQVGIGFIFYYQGRLDLTHWTLTYSNDMKMIHLPWFKLLVAITFIWAIALVLYLGMRAMERRMTAQMSNRIRTLSIMADLYLEAYIIDVSKNTAHLIKGDANKLVLDLSEKKVQEAINEKIRNHCQDFYVEQLLEFLDFSTVIDRMKDSASITFEYEDKKTGWCSIRLFRAGESINSDLIVLTLQDINEEKKKLRAIEDRMNLAEYKQNVSGSFLETVSFALNDISDKVSEDGRKIREGVSLEDSKMLADRIVMNSRHMNLIQNTMLDLYEVECKRLTLDMHPYNIFEMLDELYHILKPFSENKAYDFSFEIDKNMNPSLVGDSDRIEQILVIILFSSMLMTQSGFVKFSLFGKQHENEEELIFSIRDSAMGFSEEQLNEIHEFINGSSIETFDNASLVYLKIINGILRYMDSELKIVSVLGEGTDFYFTLRQGLAE